MVARLVEGLRALLADQGKGAPPNLDETTPLIGPDERWSEILLQVHHLDGFLFMLLVAVHVGAALRHHFWLHDDVLRRMLPALRPRP